MAEKIPSGRAVSRNHHEVIAHGGGSADKKRRLQAKPKLLVDIPNIRDVQIYGAEVFYFHGTLLFRSSQITVGQPVDIRSYLPHLLNNHLSIKQPSNRETDLVLKSRTTPDSIDMNMVTEELQLRLSHK